MIDLRAARSDPDRFRTALARKGAAEAFDELLDADERWRELVPQVDELRGRQKLKGKPTPEQVEELKQVKADLRRLEEELAAAEAERERLSLVLPNLPHESVPDGDTEEDAEEVRRVGEPPDIGEPKEHTEVGRFDMERAARLSGSRFGYLIGDTALLAFTVYHFALDRIAAKGFTPVLPPVLVREEALIGTGHFPADEQSVYAIPADELY
ncbi:MAG: serine--tRNA ligase, partial [Gaiellaceae bacterium]